jgi:hypothetical protein
MIEKELCLIPEERFVKIKKRQFAVMLWVAVAAAFSIGGTARAAEVSPVGIWDFTVTGAKLGSASLEFVNNPDPTIPGGLISGSILVVPAPHNTVASGQIQSFGFTPLTGEWQFDSQGRVVGFLNNPPADTVRLDIASLQGSVAPNGTVFTLTGQTVDGKLKLNGVPFKQLTSLPNLWTIEKMEKGKVTFTEIFVATPDPFGVGDNNLYGFSGEGADICIFGYGALSKGNNFGIAFSEFPMPTDPTLDCSSIDPATDSGGVVSAGVGKISLQTGTAKLSGTQEGSPGTPVSMPIFCQ